jgi:hypothetical protein
MIVELLRAGGPDLVRRWVATLLSVPESERRAIVESVEARIAELYHAPPVDDELVGNPEVTVRLKARPKARDGSDGRS